MGNVSARIRLRPTRIGFLVRPSDKKSLRQIMRLNACLWGGQYNPIIPVYSKTPKEWKGERYFPREGKEVARGYVRFFDPDVYVEAEKGLLERVGLGAFRGDVIEKKIHLLDEFFDDEYGGIYEPAFGQSVYDILENIYLTERRFQLRDEFPAIYSSVGDMFSELCIGCYPEGERTNIFKEKYDGVYKPEVVKFDADLWLRIYGGKCETPISVANKHLEIFRSWHDEPVIYIFDPSNCKDIIDLWNLRIQPARVYPIPIKWVDALKDPLRRFIESNYRPLKHNRNGVMHHVTIEKSRSISEQEIKEVVLPCFDGLPQGSFALKYWRTSVWDVSYRQNFVTQPERAIVTADEISCDIELKDDSLMGTFDTLSPHFAPKYSGSKHRWANVAKISAPYGGSSVALSLPFNTYDRSWPVAHSGQFANGREGWVFLQQHKSVRKFVSFIKHEDAFSKWFESLGLTANHSEAGRIAKQMIDSLGGFWGLYLLDDRESVQFINKHASSLRKRSNNNSGDVIEEEFRGRSASIDQWQAMIKRRKANGSHHSVDLKHYIERNVIKVGLESECDYCNAKNWHGLDEVSYDVRCSRCLKDYKFPQGKLKSGNRNWKYRVIGPFAVPDYAQGAYASLLTIRFFTKTLGHDVPCSYSTALEIDNNGKKTELDFAIWIPEEKQFDIVGEPRLIIGEAKSFGEDVIKDEDLEKLKKSAEAIPDSVLVISVLKESFSDAEKNRLKEFVLWAREPVDYRPRHTVILLTGIELCNEFLEKKWKEVGVPYSDHANYHSTQYLEPLSDATQAIHLGLDSYHQWLEKRQKGSNQNSRKLF